MVNDGRFVWHELRVPDPAAAARFYRELLGWSADAVPTGVTFRVSGVPLGGASDVKPGIPSHWTPFVAVADVFDLADGTRVAEVLPATPEDPFGWLPFVHVGDLEESRDRAAALGAAVPGSSVEVPGGRGRFSIIRDPQGASIALLESY
jgi:predicted enzyme related to lactoylglutathione lyase